MNPQIFSNPKTGKSLLAYPMPMLLPILARSLSPLRKYAFFFFFSEKLVPSLKEFTIFFQIFGCAGSSLPRVGVL